MIENGLVEGKLLTKTLLELHLHNHLPIRQQFLRPRSPFLRRKLCIIGSANIYGFFSWRVGIYNS